MRYLKSSVKAHLGDKIQINVSRSTRVLVMTEANYKKYKENLTFTYFGGAKDGSYEFNVPKSGLWMVIVEKGSYANPINITATVSIDRSASAALRAPQQIAEGEVKASKKDKKKKKKKSKDEVLEQASAEGSDMDSIDEGKELE